jgi:hypothetical protein
MTDQAKKPRGFQTLTPERRKEIAASGGRAAHASGNAHQYTPEEARAAAAARGDRKPKV